MDKFTIAKLTLVEAICRLLKKYGDSLTVSHLLGGNKICFYSTHYGADEKYTCEMGFRCGNGDDLIAVRTKFNSMEYTVSQHATMEALKLATRFIPFVEKYLEVEAERAGLGTE